MSADLLGDLGVVVNSPGIIVNDLGVIENEILGDASVSGLIGRQGEAAFQRMKKLADEAGWPASLTPEIVAADKGWQKAKEDVNDAGVTPKAPAAAQQLATASAKLDAMIARLEAYLKDRSAVRTGGSPPPKNDGTSSSGVAAGAADRQVDKPASGDMLDALNRQYGPLPLWGWGVAGAGLLTAGYFLIGRRDR